MIPVWVHRPPLLAIAILVPLRGSNLGTNNVPLPRCVMFRLKELRLPIEMATTRCAAACCPVEQNRVTGEIPLTQ